MSMARNEILEVIIWNKTVYLKCKFYCNISAAKSVKFAVVKFKRNYVLRKAVVKCSEIIYILRKHTESDHIFFYFKACQKKTLHHVLHTF